MSEVPGVPGQASGGSGQAPQDAEPGPVDVEKLAEKVYRLMVAEARLARARGQKPGGRRGG